MPLTKKCPECNGCMAKFWILPNRYYYCDFCLVYYGGRDDGLYIVSKDEIDRLLKEQQEKE